MGNRRPMLEPVLENYMGPPISYDTDRKPRRGAKVAPAAAGSASKASTRTSLMNPLSIFGKLRDRYIKTMNEMAMGGDYAAVAGCHGCVPGQDYPGLLDSYQQSDRHRKHELHALREELAALRSDHGESGLTTRTSRYLS